MLLMWFPSCRSRCSSVHSRLAAYEVLVMLAESSLTNLQLITQELLSMHHQPDQALSKEFDVSISGGDLLAHIVRFRFYGDLWSLMRIYLPILSFSDINEKRI